MKKKIFFLITLLIPFIVFSQKNSMDNKLSKFFVTLKGNYVFFDFGAKGYVSSFALNYKKNKHLVYGLSYNYMYGERYKKFKPNSVPDFYDPKKTNIYYKVESIYYHKFSFFVSYLPINTFIFPYFTFGFHFGPIDQTYYDVISFRYDNNGVNIKSRNDVGEKGFGKGLEIGLGFKAKFKAANIGLGATYGSTFINTTFFLYGFNVDVFLD